jgi:hypothetical protein
MRITDGADRNNSENPNAVLPLQLVEESCIRIARIMASFFISGTIKVESNILNSK